MGMCGHIRRVCTESCLWEKNPLLHQGIEPASAACQSDALAAELPSPVSLRPPPLSEEYCCYVQWDIKELVLASCPGFWLTVAVISLHTHCSFCCLRKGSTMSFLTTKYTAIGTSVPYIMALGETDSDRWIGNRNVWLPLYTLKKKKGTSFCTVWQIDEAFFLGEGGLLFFMHSERSGLKI